MKQPPRKGRHKAQPLDELPKRVSMRNARENFPFPHSTPPLPMMGRRGAKKPRYKDHK